MGHPHSEYLVLLVLAETVLWFVCALPGACLPFLFLGESEVRYKHPVLENHWHPGGREDGQTCAAQEHPDRG